MGKMTFADWGKDKDGINDLTLEQRQQIFDNMINGSPEEQEAQTNYLQEVTERDSMEGQPTSIEYDQKLNWLQEMLDRGNQDIGQSTPAMQPNYPQIQKQLLQPNKSKTQSPRTGKGNQKPQKRR